MKYFYTLNCEILLTSKSEIFSLGLFCVWTVDGGNIQSWEGQVAGETVQHSSTLAFSTTEVGKYFTELVSKLFDQIWWAPASRLEWSQQKRWWRWWGWRRWREWSNSSSWRTYPYLERLQPHQWWPEGLWEEEKAGVDHVRLRHLRLHQLPGLALTAGRGQAGETLAAAALGSLDLPHLDRLVLTNHSSVSDSIDQSQLMIVIC